MEFAVYFNIAQQRKNLVREESRIVVSNWGWHHPPGDTWQWLVTSSVVTSERGHYWNLVGRVQQFCEIFYSAQDSSPMMKYYLALNVTSAEVKTPWSGGMLLFLPSLSLGKSAVLWVSSSRPMERSTWWGTKPPQTAVSNLLSPKWAVLQGHFPASVELSDESSSSRHLDGNLMRDSQPELAS